jgi:hypothetical protein
VKKIDIDKGAVKRLPGHIKEFGYKNIFIVADKNTWKAAGEEAAAELEKAGIAYDKVILDYDEVIPDEHVIGEIPKLSIDMTANWNHRYRENMERLKSGNLIEVAGVIKALMHRDNDRGLSNGERKMLHSAKQILISEIVLAECVEYPVAEARINAAMLKKESA